MTAGQNKHSRVRLTSAEGPSWVVSRDQEVKVYISPDFCVGIPAWKLVDKDGFDAYTRDLEPGPGMKQTQIARVEWVDE